MRLAGKATAEGVGAFALTFIGGSAIVMTSHAPSGAGLLQVAAAHAIILAVMVSATMNISGGHLNPAVTIAALLTRKVDGRTAGAYVGGQLVGAALAALLIRALLPAADVEATAAGATTPAGVISGAITPLQGVGIEIVLTFFLVLAIWGTAISRRAPQGIAGFGIGLVLLADILAGGPLTGASMNPARSFGPALVSGEWGFHWIHWVGPILGAALAASLYEWIERE